MSIQKMVERRRPNSSESVCEVISVVDHLDGKAISLYDVTSSQIYRASLGKGASAEADLQTGQRVYVWYLPQNRVIITTQD